MKKELGMVGWPTKTLAINTIDLPPRDGRKVEGREAADGGKIETGKRGKARPWTTEYDYFHLGALCCFVFSNKDTPMLNSKMLFIRIPTLKKVLSFHF